MATQNDISWFRVYEMLYMHFLLQVGLLLKEMLFNACVLPDVVTALEMIPV